MVLQDGAHHPQVKTNATQFSFPYDKKIKKSVLKNVQQPVDQRRRLAPRLRPPRPPVARPRPRWREVRKPSMGFDKRRAFPTFELLFFPFKVAGSYFELNTEPVVYIGGCRQPSRIESNRVWRRLGPFELIFSPTASCFRRRGPSALHARLHAGTLFIWSRRLRKGYLNPGTTKQPFLLCLIFYFGNLHILAERVYLRLLLQHRIVLLLASLPSGGHGAERERVRGGVTNEERSFSHLRLPRPNKQSKLSVLKSAARARGLLSQDVLLMRIRGEAKAITLGDRTRTRPSTNRTKQLSKNRGSEREGNYFHRNPSRAQALCRAPLDPSLYYFSPN